MIPETRLKHSYMVGKVMYEKAKEQGWGEEKAREMYVLGLLHDLGYEYYDGTETHEHIGGKILEKDGYKYWREVYYHSAINPEYSSPELNLLNICDMIVDGNGVYCGAEKRLEDIEKRYGKNSKDYKDTVTLMEQLNLI